MLNVGKTHDTVRVVSDQIGTPTWSSVVLAFENSKRISEEVKKPKALGDIRGVSYIYPILWRFGLIRVPEEIEKRMGKQR